MANNPELYWRKTFEINRELGYQDKFDLLVAKYKEANENDAIKVNDTYVFKVLVDMGLEKMRGNK